MSNKVAGYMIAVPTIIFFILFFVAVSLPDLLANVDIQIYFVIGAVFFVGWLVSLYKLWKLDKPEKRMVPIGNKGLIGWTILVMLISSIQEVTDLGSQLEILIGFILLVLLSTTSYRLIMAKTITDEGEESKASVKTESVRFISLIVLAFVVMGLLVYSDYDGGGEEAVSEETQVEEDDFEFQTLEESEAVSVTFEVLDLLHSLYYISLDDSEEATTEQAVISTWTGELMKDRNKYDKILPRAQKLSEHPNKTVSVVGMGLFAGITQLAKSNDDMVSYLRTVDVYNLDMSEFSYRANLHNATNKEAFDFIIEGTVILPYTYIEFTEDENDINPIILSSESQNKILSEIDRLFSEIFPEHDLWNEETGNTHASVFVVRSYVDFLTGDSGQ